LSITIRLHAQAMIDTVNIFSPSTLLKSGLPAHWRRSSQQNPVPDPDGISFISRGSSFFDDPKSGYHGFGEDGEIRYHRASLPRLLHGHNGKLIKNQAELDAAMEVLQMKAGEICNASFANHHYTRVDLVLQFRGDTADFILAHRNARHPRIHRGSSFYEARSMAFKGSEMRIALYDKVLEQSHVNGDVVRVEVQLKGRILKELLGGGDQVIKLDFATCYRAYRDILLGFVPSGISKVSGIAEFLAIGERDGWSSNGIPAFDLYTRGMCRRQVNRIRGDMASCRPEVFKIDWSQLLPADAPPAVVETKEFAV